MTRAEAEAVLLAAPDLPYRFHLICIRRADIWKLSQYCGPCAGRVVLRPAKQAGVLPRREVVYTPGGDDVWPLEYDAGLMAEDANEDWCIL